MSYQNKIAFFFFCQIGMAAILPAQDQPGRTIPASVFSSRTAGDIQEKIFLHTDKTVYLAGETCWFSVYCLNAADHHPMAASRIAYIELINRSGQALAQTKVALDSGFGAGVLAVSSALPSGRYQMRAYTAWMQNSAANLFFTESITVINTLRGSGIDVPDPASPSSLVFFPEGGQIVSDLPARVACRARNGHGDPLLTKLELRDRQRNLLTAVQTDSNGIARFDLTPRAGDSLLVTIAGDNVSAFSFPQATGTGYTLMLDRQDKKLAVTIHATPSEENKSVYFVTQTRQSLKSIQTARISGGMARFNTDADSLGDGISVFTLLDENRQPVSERLFFKSPERQMKVTATTDSSTYSTRSPFRVSFSTTVAGKPVRARLSASLFRIDSLQPIPDENLLNWLLLSSDLPGLSPGAARLVERDDTGSRRLLDNIMLTNGWRRFNKLHDNSHPVLQFLPEIEGPVIRARVANRFSGQPVPNISFLLSVPGSRSAIAVSTSDKNGELLFVPGTFTSTGQLILQPLHSADSVYRTDIIHAFSDSVSAASLPAMQLTPAVTADLTERHLAVQVENSFTRAAKKPVQADPASDSISFYGIPDRNYHLENYIRYVTMEEVLREFVDDVRLRKDGSRFHFYVRNSLFNTFFESEPLILLDGVPVSDAGKIVALDPLKIRDIYVVTHRFYKGSDDFPGIIAIRSYSAETGIANLDPGAVILDYAGLQQRREFYSPDYSDSAAAGSTLPDYRTTLWWAPDLRTGMEGVIRQKAYAGDLGGHYALLVEGITADGQAGYDIKVITVGATRSPGH